jgi:hypothetical protein
MSIFFWLMDQRMARLMPFVTSGDSKQWLGDREVLIGIKLNNNNFLKCSFALRDAGRRSPRTAFGVGGLTWGRSR